METAYSFGMEAGIACLALLFVWALIRLSLIGRI